MELTSNSNGENIPSWRPKCVPFSQTWTELLTHRTELLYSVIIHMRRRRAGLAAMSSLLGSVVPTRNPSTAKSLQIFRRCGQLRRAMLNVLRSLVGAVRSFFKTQRDLAMENLALRHQIGVLKRTVGKRRLRLKAADRGLWAGLSRIWAGWEHALAIVQPATVIRWRREGFKRYWTRKSRASLGGRPTLERDVRELIRKISKANPIWGAPRICNELAKLGIEVSRSTVAKYMVRQRKPPSPTWRAFLDNHVKDLVSIDFFVIPTATFRVLFGFLVLAHDRRRVLHCNVTSSPSAEWTAAQIVQGIPRRDRSPLPSARPRRDLCPVFPPSRP